MEIEPPEGDSDEEIVEALMLVLEMDPLLDASQLRASCEASAVTLEGYVPGEERRRRAEVDAWAVFGVDRVKNRIVVQS
jgi:osmotically-inducible protein OsmY